MRASWFTSCRKVTCAVAIASGLLMVPIQSDEVVEEAPVADSPVDKLLDAWIQKLSDRTTTAPFPHDGQLDETMLGKTHHLAVKQMPHRAGFEMDRSNEMAPRSMRGVRVSARQESVRSTSVSRTLSTLDQLLPEEAVDVGLLVGAKPAMALESSSPAAQQPREAAENRAGFGGKRIYRGELEELMDSSLYWEGGKTILRALQLGGMGDLSQVHKGQLVVVAEDSPPDLLKGQAYEVQRIYYQLRGDYSGKSRVEVETFASPPPPVAHKGDVWEHWCDLYSDHYHSRAVHVRPEDVQLRSVGGEIHEALKIALPVAFFPIALIIIASSF
eukprot:gnl/TRDRNA2_/TRDRNA2_200309_c0_seq1.p1 gnl/TRDRNA2_/TRDRNA2_200309_c0~~gnl/TRDRNA2_/TRDRNA2_200309_c0_seq1.p1  ORF type:complete len:329 (+),score=39.26 gnl/TRDRNA2_/TRDRNA2_200309_c0_seq1:74-1060(+)